MKNKILIMLLVLMLIAYPMAAYAYDQSSFAATSVNFVVTTLTTFSYTQVATVENMNFVGNRNSKNVYPDGTSGGTTAWARINNTGEVNQSFIARLNSNNPPGFELLISNNQDMSENIAVTTAPQSPSNWTNVPPLGIINLYAKANFNGAPDGTVSKKLMVGLPPVVKSISVAPKTATVMEWNSQQFTAATTDQYDMAFIAPVTWSNENLDVGTIDSTGKYTAKGGVAGRVDTIKATAGSKNDTAIVTVIATI